MTTTMLTGKRLDVAVDGGTLAVWRFGTGDRVVLAPHGITANHVSWRWIAEALVDEDVTLLAPDLRGRGDSAALPGPSSMAQHADDLVAVLDHLGVDSAVWAGHSMGAFVAVRAALRHPDRVDGLLLLDGGLALPVPAGVPVDDVLDAVVGPAMQRLTMRWDELDGYLDFWRPHPAFVDDWNPLVEAYLGHDVHEVDGVVASRVVAERVREDGRDTLEAPVLADGLAAIDVPVRFLWAPRGLLGADPLYPREVVAAFEQQVPDLEVVELTDVNHYTLALSRHGAEQVAAELAAFAARVQ